MVHLGCPFWAGEAWAGTLFRTRARPAEYLEQYAEAFDAVEGNTTFYGIPSQQTIGSWAAATPTSFRFLLKFPREVTHYSGLADVGRALEFVSSFEALGQRAIFWLQLPPWWEALGALEILLRKLPPIPLVVEARHPSLYAAGEVEKRFDRLLMDFGADRVHFDTTELQRLKTSDPDLLAAKERKPALPRRIHALGPRPVLRYIGDPDGGDGQALEDWADIVAGWVAEGRQPLCFMHTAPDDAKAPELCRDFHERLCQRLPLPPMPRWPGEREPKQLLLFEEL